MKITNFDDTYSQKLGLGETTLVSGTSGGSNSTFGGDVSGSPGNLSVDGLRRSVSLASNLGTGVSIGDVLTIQSVAGTPVAHFAAPSNTGGTSSLPWFVVTTYGAVHDGVTDDTVAIQATINAAFAAGGGVVFFPDGVYIIGGALQDTAGYNSQLKIPQQPVSGTNPLITIELRGNTNTDGYWFFDGRAPTTGAILKSTLSPAISGFPAVISCGLHGSPWFGGGAANLVDLRITGLTIRQIDDPKMIAVQAQAAWLLQMRHVSIDTDIDQNHAAQPTHSNAYGVTGTTINGAQTLLDDVWVVNHYTGVMHNENTTVVGDLWIENCVVGIEVAGPAYHACHYKRVSIVWCPTGIKFTGGVAQIVIAQMDIEHANTGWQTTVADISDASNYARGFVAWHTVLAGTGIDDSLMVTGGTGLSFHDIVKGRWTFTDTVRLPAARTDPTDNPSSGGLLYAANSGGHPKWRDTTGTVADLLTDVSGVTVTGTPSSGQVLTATSASAASWSTPSTSSGVGDHEHMVEVFVGDGSTTVFEIADEPIDPEAVIAFVSGSETAVTMSGTMNTTATFGSAPGAAARVVIQYPAVSA